MKDRKDKKTKIPAVFEQMEPRVLFSAGLESALASDQLEAPTDVYNQTVLKQSLEGNSSTDSETPATATRVELIFVDTDTPEYQTLLSDLLAYPDDSTSYQVFELDNTKDGIAQITAVLSGYDNVNALHILSHGSEGAIDLGGSTLNNDSLAANTDQLSNWSLAFSEGADILIYGCNLAANAEGQLLVNSLAQLTGADVAASDDLTGSAQLGGDWDLEYQAGSIETAVAVSATLEQEWTGTLAAPTGGEQLVNTELADSQRTSQGDHTPQAVATNASGDSVIVWQSNLQDLNQWGVYAQLMDAAGNKVGSEIAVTTTTTGNQFESSVAIDANGNFVISWSGEGPGDTTGIFARRFDASGNALDAQEFLVNTSVGVSEGNPAIAMDDDGDFVIAWQGTDADVDGIFARRFAADGTAKDASEFLVNTTTGEVQKKPAVVMDAVGNFVIAWESDTDPSTSDNFDIFFQRYNAAGNTLGLETQVNTDNGEIQGDPGIAMNASGAFVISWESDDDTSNSTDLNIYFQRYDATGTALGINTLANSVTPNDQSNSSVAMAPDDSFVIVWQSFNGADDDIYVREFDSAGNPLAAETRVNTTTAAQQTAPSIGMSAAGSYLVVWSGNGPGDAGGVFAQQYALPNNAPVLTGANNLTAINEDPVSNGGTLVSALIAGQVTDADTGALSGIAVIGVDNTNGSWEYTTNGGGAWQAFGSPDSTAARLLAADVNTSVRFVPDANWNGTISNGITFHAWDQTSGSNGGTAAIPFDAETLLDNFDSQSYSLDNGTQSWSTSWVETDASSPGPVSGYIKIITAQNELRITAAAIGDNIYREADLSGATSATLSFFFENTSLSGSAQIDVQVSGNGGVGYTTLYSFTAADTTGTQNYDISSYIASDTRVRFYVVDDSGPAGELTIDDVQLAYSIPGGGTTAFSIASDTSSLVVNPVNDAPVIAVVDVTGAITEGSTLTDSGSITFTDVETADTPTATEATKSITTTLTLTAAQQTAIEDAFTISPDAGNTNNGIINWDYTITEAELDFLAAGETVTVVYTITVDDGNSGTDTEDVTITITGSTDAPVIAVVDVTGGITEGTTLTDNGSITFTDLDLTDTPTASEATKSITTTLTLTAAQQTAIEDAFTISPDAGNTNNGIINWDYTITEAELDFLAAGETVTVVYTITVDDGNGGTDTGDVTITITGSNDAPVIAVVDVTGAITESTTLTDNGSITFTDLDLTDTPTASEATKSITTTLTLTAAQQTAIEDAFTISADAGNTNNGTINWDYTITEAELDFLADGETVTVVYTITVNDANGGIDTQDVTVTITGSNDAPILDNTGTMSLPNIFKNVTDPEGSLVSAIIDSAGGNRIMDVDNGFVEGIAVTAADNINGSWEYSTNGGTSWTAFGAVTNATAVLLTDTANDLIRFIPGLDYVGDATITFRAWDTSDTNVSGATDIDTGAGGTTTAFSSATETAAITIDGTAVKLLLSTTGDLGSANGASNSGVPGMPSWTDGSILTMRDTGNLTFGENNTGGTFSVLNNFDTFAADSEVALTGLHFLTENITVSGTGISGGSVDLLPRDVIFVTELGETLSNAAAGAPAGWANNIVTSAGGIYAFRPVSADDYSSGYFRLIMNDPATNQTQGITLVESNTRIGDTWIDAGDFLYAQSGAAEENKIYWYDTSTNTSIMLIDGADIGITGSKILGIEVIEESATVGGMSLSEGNILLTIDKSDNVGNNNQSVKPQDIFVLNIISTTHGSGTAVATASVLFDGDGDANFNTGSENLDALSLIVEGVSGNFAPVLGTSAPAASFSEGASPVIIDASITVADGDSADFASGLIVADISTGGTAYDRLSVFNQGSGAGQIGVTGNTISYGGITIGSFYGGLGGDPLIINLNANADVIATQALMRNITFWNVSTAPSTVARTVDFVLNDGDGGNSNVISQTVTVAAALPAAPVAVHDGPGLDFDGIDDYVSIADSASLTMTTTMTMEAWVKADTSVNDPQIIINKEGEYEVALFADGNIGWAFANTDPGWTWHDTGYVVADGEWTHIAVAYDNGAVSTYVNGTLVDLYNGSGAIGDAHNPLDDLRIGGRSNNPAGQYFDGQIDDVRIWNTARTQAEIEAAMDQALTGGEAGLAGYWNFNEGTGTSVADLTANGNTGTLIDGGAGTAGPQWTGYSTDQDTQITINAANGMVANDFDGDGDPLTVTEVNGNVGGANVGTLFTLPSGANLTVGTAGDFIYDPNGAFDDLAVGERGTDSFTYKIDDGNGGTDTATVTIHLTGVNDAPVIAVVDVTGGITEGTTLSDTGSITFTDVDLTDTPTASEATKSVTTALTLTAAQQTAIEDAFTISPDAGNTNNGTINWDYTITEAELDFLAAGETVTVVYTITVDDGNGGTDTEDVTVTITGSTDAPVIAVVDVAGSITEGTTLSDTGSITFTDLDLTDTPTPTEATKSVTTTLTLTAAQQTAIEDAFTISADVGNTNNGTINWDYTITEAELDFLAAGETVTVVYTITVDDGNGGTDTQDVTVTITGSNDAPIIAVVDVAGSITEGTTLSDTGSITFTDLDLTDTPTASEATKSVTTTLTLTAAQQTAVEDAFTISADAGNTNNGTINWDYTITEAELDFLADGETVTVVYTITVDDGNGSTDTEDVTVTITGSTDAPVIAVVDVTGGITEGTTLSDTGSITFTDLDLTDTPTATEATKSVTTTLTLTAAQQTAIEDAFTISADGGNTNNGTINWDYTITEAELDFLAAGETVTVVYTITVDDGNGGTDTQDVTVTITGSTDAPVIAIVDVAGSITEGTTLSDSGSITFTDLDLTDTPTATEATKSVTTTLTLTAAQQTAIEDAFTISPDAGNTNNGTINWDYTITEANLDFLAAGETVTVVYTITVNDANGGTDTQDVTVTITGSNDAPVIAVVDITGAITEGTTLNDTGSITFTDLDLTDTPTASEATKSVTTALTLTAAQQTAIEDAFTISPDAGNTNNGTINWDYTITEAELDFLAAGETVTVVYTITVDDGNGGTDTEDVTVTITGSNDAPVIAVVDVTGSITEGTTLNDTGSITFTDLDLTDTPTASEVTKSVTTALTLTAAQQTAIEDAFTISPDAGNTNNGTINWDYTITEAELDFLAAGETVTVVYTITVNDANGGTDTEDVTVTITGSNDAPVIAVVDVTGSITEGTTLSDTGSITFTDLDLTDTPTASEVTKSVTTALTLTAAQQTAIEDAFTISPDAGNTNNGTINWDYTITEAELDFLAAGETVTVVYTITVNDANGGTDTQDVTITITGSNDAPVIAVVDVTGGITEGTTLSDAGSITFTDLDLTDTPTASEATKSVTTALTLTAAQQTAIEDAFTISPDAGNTNNGTINWDYTITEAELDFLADGETVTVVYTITINDANGGTDTEDVTVTITGSNDAPVIAVVDVTGSITEGTTLSDTGSITFTDLDLTDTPTASEVTKSVTTALTLTAAQQTAIEDAFTISADAGNTNNGTINWDYTITEAELDFLAAGETVTVVYTITVDDGNGGTDTEDVTVTITGSNDVPVIAVVDVSGSITEGTTLSDTGSITFTDLDLTDTPTATEATKSVTTTLTLTAAQQTAIEDAFTISADAGNTNNGTINWDYTITEAELDFLADGETVTVVYTITVNDGNGGTDTQDVMVTITGSNDAPIIAVVDVTGAITEGTTLSDTGSITFTDLDLTDTSTATEATKSVTTTLTLTAAQQTAIEDAFTISADAGNTNNGTINWDYTITEAELDFLAAGETVTVVYTITVDDGNGGTDTEDVTVTITGSNDAPVIAVVDVVGSITEGTTLSDTGSITFTDLDLTDTPTATEATKSVTTTLTLTAAQQTAIEDAFTISPDAGNTNNGTINWDYMITEAELDFLAAGETVTVVYTITVNDANGGTDTQDVTVTITGSNDAPVIAVVDVAGSITEGTTLSDAGSITFTDLDLTDTPTATEDTKSVTTTLTLTAAQQTAIEDAFTISPDAGNTNNGTINWDYTITETELNFLAAGETVTVVYTITVNDSNGGTDTQDVTVTITGSNDAPVIAIVDVTGAITEGTTLNDTGSITFTDLDLTDTPTATEATKSVTTTLTLTAAQQTAIEDAFTISADAGNTNNGTINWDYTITEAELDFLAAGETVTVVYTITVDDGNGGTDTQDVTVTITGSNDAPVIAVVDVTGAITEGTTLNDTGSITFTDLDLTDTPTATEATKSVTTTLTLTAAQQTAIEDAFTISADAGNTNNGTINWDYTITEAELDFLAAGETVTVVYTITVNDGNGGTDTQDVTVTITGSNDAPIIAVVDVTGAITEGTTLNDTGSITFTDLDLTDTPTATEATKSVTTTLTLTAAQQTAIEDAFTISADAGNTNNGTINWDYTITEAELDFLAAGETVTVVYTMSVNDGNGGTDTQDVTVSITGSNDAPVIAVVDVTGTITEGATLSDTGSITFTDLDLTDTPTAMEATKSVTTVLTLTAAQQTAIEDAFTISPDAGNTNNGTINWDYTITEAELDFLAAGETVTVVYTITVDDSNGGTDTQDVTVTITGSNDAPVIAVVDVTGAITEGTTLNDIGSITFTDLDLTDTPTATEATKSVTTTLTLTAAQQTAIEDAFTISADAGNTNNGTINWDYTITETELNFLAAGETVTVVYTITVNDSNGGTDTQDVTVTITGSNDAPVIAIVDVTGAITEGTTLNDTGSITFTDLDLTDTPTATEATKSVTTTLTLTAAQQTAIEDAFTISADAGNTNNGTINWDYTIAEADIDFLESGDTITVVYTITVDDGNGGTDTEDVTVTITGSNDAPVIAVVDVTGAITEGTTLTDNGSITFTDLDLTNTPTATEATKSVTTALTLTAAQQTAIEAAFTISPDAGNTNNGTIYWDYTITESELDFLAAGETVTAVFTITVDDAGGGTDTQDVTVTITGSNDAPVIAVVDVTGAITEGTTLTDNGSITFADLDLTDTPTAIEATKSITTTLTLTAAQQTAIEDAFTISPDAGNTNNGTINWDYTITEAELDFLAAGETVTVVYTITVDDANGGTDTQDVTVTITGSTDAPVIAVVDVAGAITEGTTLSDGGSITFTDLDLTDTPTAIEATKSVTTTLTLTAAQQTAIEDAFTISADAGNTNNGTINWDYTITEAELDFLAAGETVTVVYTITVDDGNGGTDTQDVTITITGSTDAPVITVVDVTGAITEGATLSDSGSITFTDLDLTDTPTAIEATKSVTTALTLTAAQQTAIEDAFTISADAGNTNNGTINWDYTITEAELDFLAASETVTVVYTITVNDGNGGTDTEDVTVTITGSNDAPVIAVVDVAGAITEGATLNDTGSITFTDLDLTDTPTASEATKSVTTALTLTAAQQTAIEDAFTISADAGNTNNGTINWDYTITEAELDFLAAGETVTVVYTITVNDANGGTDTEDVTVTITGSNDAPVIAVVDVAGSITEGTTLNDTGSITFTDLDLTDTPTASEATKSVTTTLTLTAAQQTAIEDAFTISPDAGNTNNGAINWDYTITEAELDFLAAGETVTVVYTITVDDGNGGTYTEDVTVTITGSNDAPVIAVVDVAGSITEGVTLSDTGSITFTDLDLTDTPTATEATKSVTTTLTLTAAQQAALEDAFTISPDAGNTNNGTINWDYTITEAELDFLAPGETVTVVYTITVNDGNGSTDTEDVTVTITGSNDAPVIAVVDVDGSITEGTTLNDTGSITFTDLDLTDTPTATEATKSVTTALTLTAAQQTAIEDAFTISPDAGNNNNGTINWDYTITEAELDFLAAGETVTVVYTITVNDGNGGTDNQDVTVTITGSNDAPVIAVVDVDGSITEGTTLNDTGSITFTDLDLTDTPTATEATKSVTTALTLTAAQQTAIEDAFTISPDAGNTNNGTINWDYTITEAELDFLAAGETVTVVYTITVNDANGGTDTEDVTVTITGSNDAPVIAVVDVTGSITEGTTLNDTGSITFTDLDLTDTPTATEATKSVTTTLTLTAAQQTAIEDAFTISADAGNTNNGTINWDYTITEAELDFLAPGETVTVVYTITVDDGNGGTDTQDVTVTITGSNDAPVIAVVDVTGAITEGTTLNDTGSITFTDLDLTDTPTATEATKSVTTALTLTAAQQTTIEDAFTISPDAGNTNNGSVNWDYTITEAELDFLAAGETVTVVYTITVDDGNGGTDTQDVTVTITGSNDAPVIAVVDVTGAITEGTTLNDTGSISFTDIDLTDTPTATEVTKSVTTTLTLTAAQQTAIEDAFTISPDAGNTNNGTINWDYTITEAELDFLAAGETVTVVYTITVDDGNGGTDTEDVTVTITGSTDAPVIAVVDVTGSITEGSTLSDTGSITFTDLDLTDTPTATEATKSVTTTLTLTAAQQTAIEDAFTISPDAGNTNNGSINWDYTITEAELDFLAAGETVTVVYTITVDDGNGGTDNQDVTVTITGSNDAPVIAVVDVDGSITEGTTLNDTGSITFTDLDLTDTPTATESTKSVTTTLTLTAAQQTAIEDAFTISADAGNTNNGIINWDYTITEAELDFLAAGETVTVVYTITVADGNGGTDTQDVTVTITGSNDTPAVSNVAINATEDGAAVNGSFVASDADSTDTHIFILTGSPAEGTVINNNNGTFTFDPGTDFQDLAPGETRDVSFTYTATDDSGAGNATSMNATVTVTVTGTNDQPAASNVAINATEDGATVNGTFVVSDADTTDTHTFNITGSPLEGSVVNNNDGTFTFNPGTDFQNLAQGETRDVTFTYVAIDDSGSGNRTSANATVTITVTGTNDAPVATGNDYAENEDTAISGNVISDNTGSGKDSDVDSNTLTAALVSDVTNGVLVLNADGSFLYTPDPDYAGIDSFTYMTNDGISNSAIATVTLTIADIPEPPVVLPPGTDPGTDPGPSSTPPEDEYEDLQYDQTIARDIQSFKNNITLSSAHNTDNSITPESGRTDYSLYTELRQNIEVNKHDLPTSMELWQMIDVMKQQININSDENRSYIQLFAQSASGMALSLSAGIITWALRGGSLLASMMSSVPLWKGFDPLPIIAGAKRRKEEDEVEDELMQNIFNIDGDENTNGNSNSTDSGTGENSSHD